MRIAVVGATGAVGRLLLAMLSERGVAADEVVPFASERSAGTVLEGYGEVQPLSSETIANFDLALFSAGGSTSREWAPQFAAAGALVVDNSSAWRMDDQVPLVVSEINPDAIADAPKGIVANPNCTTMVAMLPLKALHDRFGLTAMVATSYQAAGGAGRSGIDELAAQVPVLHEDVDLLLSDGEKAARKVTAEVHANTLAYNVVPMLGALEANGYTDEEMKLQNESRKILGLPSLQVSPTCVRVPVMVGHSEAVNIEFHNPLDEDEARDILRDAPGVVVIDNRTGNDGYITPKEAQGEFSVFVSRIRNDPTVKHGLNLWVVSDNLRKGAALNAVQIAELLHERGLIAKQLA